MTFVLVLMQGNWDLMAKKYGDTQEGSFIRYVTTLVSLRPHSICRTVRACYTSPLPPKKYIYNKLLIIDRAPLFLVTSSPPTRRQQSFPVSSPPARSLNSRGHWSRALRTSGSAQGGSRASRASPGSLKRCRSCCVDPDLPSVESQVWAGNKLARRWHTLVHSQCVKGHLS